jgi:hypothetical protein
LSEANSCSSQLLGLHHCDTAGRADQLAFPESPESLDGVLLGERRPEKLRRLTQLDK